jgi:hypothetical protein
VSWGQSDTRSAAAEETDFNAKDAKVRKDKNKEMSDSVIVFPSFASFAVNPPELPAPVRKNDVNTRSSRYIPRPSAFAIASSARRAMSW